MFPGRNITFDDTAALDPAEGVTSYMKHARYSLSKISYYSDFETHLPVKFSNQGTWRCTNIPHLTKLVTEKLSN